MRHMGMRGSCTTAEASMASGGRLVRMEAVLVTVELVSGSVGALGATAADVGAGGGVVGWSGSTWAAGGVCCDDEEGVIGVMSAEV